MAVNSDRLADWLQVIANLGIVIGLVLVLLQMNQNEELQRVEILNQYASAYAQYEAGFAGEQLPAVWEKSIREPQNLTMAEMRVLESVTFTPLQRWLFMYRLAEHGVLTETDWRQEVELDASFYFGTPYGLAWWEQMGRRFHEVGLIPDEIYQMVEAVVSDPESVNVVSNYAEIQDIIRRNIPASQVDLTGNWEIHASVGGTIPITVNCDFSQIENSLEGSCTPVMENPEASALAGNISGDTATWGYNVVFNGNPGTVSFQANTITTNGMLGTINLSGTQAPFSAIRR